MQKILKNMQGMNAIAKHVHLMHLYIENNGKVTQWTAKNTQNLSVCITFISYEQYYF